MERLLGKLEGDLPGPLIICLAGVHGNEQIGIHAFNNVFSAIEKHGIKFRGKLIGIAGNIKAIEANRRFIDYDLNRCWTEDFISGARTGKNNAAEDEELLAIIDIIEKESEGPFTLKVIADLHSTSSDKGSFIVIPEELGEHPIVRALKLPVALDLHKHLNGTLLSYYGDKGFVSFAFEGGMVGSTKVYQVHTSGLWEIMEKAGCISKHDHENEDHYSEYLAEISRELPSKVKVKFKKSITPSDRFRMLPGYHNFQHVHKGQHLGFDKNGEILAPIEGLIFMPLYQPEGEDGFFIVEAIQ